MDYEPIKNTVHAFYVEFFGSAFLGFAIFALTNPKSPIPGSMVPLIIAAAYGAMVASLGALTGYVATNDCKEFVSCGLRTDYISHHTFVCILVCVACFNSIGTKCSAKSCERSGRSARLANDWMGSQSNDLLRTLHSRTAHWWTHWGMDCRPSLVSVIKQYSNLLVYGYEGNA
jgi:formate/nitrite transporter FocA (FNT family)